MPIRFYNKCNLSPITFVPCSTANFFIVMVLLCLTAAFSFFLCYLWMSIKPFAQDILPIFFISLTVPSASNVSISDKYLYTLMHSIEIRVSNSSMSFLSTVSSFSSIELLPILKCVHL